jgi:hypothetical protein
MPVFAVAMRIIGSVILLGRERLACQRKRSLPWKVMKYMRKV